MVAPKNVHSGDLLRRFFGEHPPAGIAFRLSDGSLWPDATPRPATVVLKHPAAFESLYDARSEQALAEAYMRDDFDVEGDIESALALVALVRERAKGRWLPLQQSIAALRSRVSGFTPWRLRPHAARPLHSRERDRRAVAFHYDLSNDFFALWLDPLMLYSCAYFEEPDDPVDVAQIAKVRHICRKLRLLPRQHLLDLGCGWGGFARIAVRDYQVNVTGITVSAAQATLAEQLIAADGLDDRARVECADYRDLPDLVPYDAIVSIGMSEHVGRENLPDYFRKAWTLLRPGGVFLHQAIGEGPRLHPRFGPAFIGDYIFPDTDIPPLNVLLGAAEGAGFEVRDVENLREHYTLTLRHWRRRLEQHHHDALLWVNEATYRACRLYLAACARAFECGELAVYQTLLSRSGADGCSGLPLTRTSIWD